MHASKWSGDRSYRLRCEIYALTQDVFPLMWCILGEFRPLLVRTHHIWYWNHHDNFPRCIAVCGLHVCVCVDRQLPEWPCLHGLSIVHICSQYFDRAVIDVPSHLDHFHAALKQYRPALLRGIPSGSPLLAVFYWADCLLPLGNALSVEHGVSARALHGQSAVSGTFP